MLRIKFKVNVFGYKTIYILTSLYLKQYFVPVSSIPYVTSNITYHQQSFAVAGPTLWFAHPLEIRSSSSLLLFHSRPKTLLFREACNFSASLFTIWTVINIADFFLNFIVFNSNHDLIFVIYLEVLACF